jgi:hypothetical protein
MYSRRRNSSRHVPDGSATAHIYRPKIAMVLAEGYNLGCFRGDKLAALTVANWGRVHHCVVSATRDDLKSAAILFASDAGKHITGQILAVDGGLTAVLASG